MRQTLALITALALAPGMAAAMDCIDKSGEAGSFELTLESGGIPRTYRLHVPPRYDPGALTSLVLNLHGVTSSGAAQESMSGFSDKADEQGFIVVHPDGYGASWNAGWCCSPATEDGIDDVQFARDLVAAVSAQYCIDPDRIFATGFSNGGFMSHRLGCEASDLFAAIAPASGVIATDACDPPRPVPVIQTHGKVDLIVPYSTGIESNQQWAAHNACSSTTKVVYRKGLATCSVYQGCADNAEVEWCEIRGMGHVWPTSETGPGWIDATDTFWEFLSRHPFGQ